MAGLEPHAVARAHLDYVQHHGRAWREDLSRQTIQEIYRSLDSPALVSFDLDALSQAEAPGVSAPNASGMSREAWLWAAEAAGRSPAVTSTDVVELNPLLIGMARPPGWQRSRCGGCYEAVPSDPDASCAAGSGGAL